jgi:CBS domain-containing protein
MIFAGVQMLSADFGETNENTQKVEDAMQVQEIMTKKLFCCTPEISLPRVARMMAEHDCGAIPVIEDARSARPIGIITDRDITCRAIAEDGNPRELTAADCMSSPAFTVTADTSVEDCCKLMERAQVRRILVVDSEGDCCGIVAQADIARNAPSRETAEVVQEISKMSAVPKM